MIAERQIQVPQGNTRVLEVDGPRPEHPVLLVHGNPSNAGDWKPFLERLEGRRRAIAPDLLGWGKSDRPAAFPGTMEALAGWLGDAIDALGVERFDLVVHDWGGIALVTALATAGGRGPGGGHELRAADARLPLALDRAAVAPPRSGRAAERDHVEVRHAPAAASGAREQGRDPGARGPDPRALRPGHEARGARAVSGRGPREVRTPRPPA